MEQRKVSLQTRILVLIIVLLLFVIALLTICFGFLQSSARQKQAEQLAVQTARTISYMPPIKSSMAASLASAGEEQAVLEQMKEQVSAHAIFITNQKGRVLLHTDDEHVGRTISLADGRSTLLFGGTSISAGTSNGETVLRGSAPIMKESDEFEKIIGTVTVEFLKKDIDRATTKQLFTLSYLALLVLLPGIFGAIFLAKSIRKDTLGLEPHEIASLYREREAMLLAIKEGIIAFDRKGRITMMNTSAEKMLRVHSTQSLHIDQVLSKADVLSLLTLESIEPNIETEVNQKTFVLNVKKVVQGSIVYGGIVSFREKTELTKLLDTLTEVSQYSEDLRAQTHEFSNKLYAILGLLELKQFDEAIELIKDEYTLQNRQHDLLMKQIQSPKIQAILLGKLGKASEKKVNFRIDENSSLEPLPNHLSLSHFITIIGNLVDNAFEAVLHKDKREVDFFITDIGLDIIIEVSDSGDGVKEAERINIFTRGHSTKGEARGYGLANVKEVLDELGGWIEVTNKKEGGALFTVYIPKETKGDLSSD
ncbi:ATP-binding protein [Bacillus sp. NPDC077027]|uniref:sensor histidine kinase n=1 Tax=Bacillus sp. NPDC077027 TaxID=3390548 RepID=UPI003D059AC7